MKKIELIVKVTENCNLRCKYCYNSESAYTDAILPLGKFEKLLNVLIGEYNLINVIWHGGEPLLAGLDYFKKAVDVERKLYLQNGVIIENSIQTNGTLIDKKWLAFFKKHDFKVGISFDGTENDRYRQGTKKTLAAMKLLKNNGFKFACNCVVADNSFDLGKNYDWFATEQIDFDYSFVFAEGAAKDNNSLDVVKYTEGMINLFDRWLFDKNGVSVRTFTFFVSLATGGRFRICNCCSCHMKYLCITPDGSLFNCARNSVRAYPFGNVDEINSVKDIFTSAGALKLIGASVKRREKCKVDCNYYALCSGGCADIAILENGAEERPKAYCYFFKNMYGHVKESMAKIFGENVSLEELNPSVKRALAKGLVKTENVADTRLTNGYKR